MPHAPAPAPTPGFEQSREGVFLLDAVGRLRQVAAGFAQLLHHPADDLVGQPLTEWVASAAPPELERCVRRAAAGEVVSVEVVLPTTVPAAAYRLTLLPLPAGSGLYGLLTPITTAASQQDAELREREQHLAVIFNNTADVTYVLRVEADEQFRFVCVNRAFERITGVAAGQVVGKLVQEVVPEPARQQVLTHYRTALRTRQPVAWQETSDYPAGRKTGEVHVTPILEADGTCCQLVGIVHDLTQGKEAEARLRASNERFQYALKATTDALYDWNIGADTLYWGEGFEELFGHRLTRNPTPFSTWASYVKPAEHDRVVAGLRHTALQTTDLLWQEEYHFRRADGSWAVVFDRGYILRDAQGQAVRMIGAMQDITARKQAEDQQHLLADKLGKQNADMQQFTYIVSHNLRAPLANALGYADLLSRIDKTSTVFDESLGHLRTSLHLLDDVLTDINSILSIRDQQGSYRPEPVALAEVCQQALQGLKEQLRECGGQLQCTIAPELHVPGNRAYFHSIFHNLVSNAIKYRSDERPLQISIDATAGAGQSVGIVVEDNGSGFDQQQAGSDIFQLHRRFHPDKPGRGIGLFLVKSHVESMQGRISIESQPGVGTRITLTF